MQYKERERQRERDRDTETERGERDGERWKNDNCPT